MLTIYNRLRKIVRESMQADTHVFIRIKLLLFSEDSVQRNRRGKKESRVNIDKERESVQTDTV